MTKMIPYFKAVLLVAVVCSSSLASARRIKLKNPRDATIIKLKIDPWSPDGYKFGYQTSFGSSRSEIGYLKIAPDGRRFLATKGEYSYFGPDRKFYKVNYVADENGYRPYYHSLVETRSKPIPKAVENDYFVFPDDDALSSPLPTTTTSRPPVSTDLPIPSSTEHGAPGSVVTEPIIELPINATVGDRFGALPPGLVGSLLGK